MKFNKKSTATDDPTLLQGRWLQVAYERDGGVETVDQEKGWQPSAEIICFVAKSSKME